MTLVNVSPEVSTSAKKHISMHFTLYNLKVLFPPTIANGFHISSTGSFLLVVALLIDYTVGGEIAFLLGKGYIS